MQRLVVKVLRKEMKNLRNVKIAAMTTIRKDMAFLSRKMLFNMAMIRTQMMPEKIEDCKVTKRQGKHHSRQVIIQ